MLDWILHFTHDLSFTVWLGGLIAIDCIEAPARFRTPELNRNQIVAVGRQVFAAFNRAEIVMGTMIIGVNLIWLFRADSTNFFDRAPGQIRLAGVCVMTLIALLQCLKLRPRMTEISKGLDLVHREESDPRFTELKGLHKSYIALEVAKTVLGLTILGFQALARS